MKHTEYYVAMLIDGNMVPSSAVANGPLYKMQAVVKRLMRSERHPSVSFQAFPCVGVPCSI